MEADYESHEIVHVVGAFRLIDAESYVRRFHRCSRAPLPRGYYVVHWPDNSGCRRFDEHARFRGPWSTRKEAEKHLALYKMLDRAWQSATVTPSVPSSAAVSDRTAFGPLGNLSDWIQVCEQSVPESTSSPTAEASDRLPETVSKRVARERRPEHASA